MAKSGLYALAALDGAPLDPHALAVMGLDGPGEYRRESPGISAQAVDREEAGRAVSIADRADGFTLLLGHLDEQDELADALGMARDAPGAALAAAVLARFGADAPMRMIGEWNLLDWHAPSRTLTLLMSEAARDPFYFAVAGGTVAVSAELGRLTRLSGVGRAFDPAGLMLHWGTAQLRRYLTEETVFANVRRVMPGSRETFRITGRETLRLPPPEPVERWRGTRAEAQEAMEAVLRRIVGQHLSRHGRAASLLSGGLDSSLIAWLGASEMRADQPLTFFSSVAPEGSGVPDERVFAAAVAERLGLPIRFIAPAADASIYLPQPRMFAHNEIPIASPRHYLYDALYQAAFDDGAELLLDGAYGELTVTSQHLLRLPLWNPRRHVRAWRDWRKARAANRLPPSLPFHAQVSRDLGESLPRLVPFDWRSPIEPPPLLGPDALWGRRPGVSKNTMTPTTSPESRLRHVIPFRDRRLLNLVAGMPVGYVEHEGLNRAPARVMLRDRLPDSVRLRRTGMPFSPDFLLRAERQAAGLIGHIGDFRAVGADEWLDLEWLEVELHKLKNPGSASYARVHKVQATAVAAAYMMWWAGQ